mmetsp:Transcript_8489/g.16705  ORF Transcript_8489/g.16705 Transcript_8489/m.16705 type:complete len:127 (-) Transcript_8489:218-598(-)
MPNNNFQRNLKCIATQVKATDLIACNESNAINPQLPSQYFTTAEYCHLTKIPRLIHATRGAMIHQNRKYRARFKQLMTSHRKGIIHPCICFMNSYKMMSKSQLEITLATTPNWSWLTHSRVFVSLK